MMRLLVADVETYGTDPKNGKLLGVALCFVDDLASAHYVPLQWYDYTTSSWTKAESYDLLVSMLIILLQANLLVGHNYMYDKRWLDHTLSINTTWHADTRLMWHLSAAPSGPRPYGLKDAQVELLGYKAKGNMELEEQVKARGGTLKGGGHYLADMNILAKYASLDAKSTTELYLKLKPFFDKHSYWWMLDKMMAYSELLQWCTDCGVKVEENKLGKLIETLDQDRKDAGTAFVEQMDPHIRRLERMWREDRAARYNLDHARQRFLASYDMQKKFSLSSDKDKRELFYDIVGLPIVNKTEGGKGATGVEDVKIASRDREDISAAVERYEIYERSETLLNSFSKPWLSSTVNGRLHPRFNPCGTVSYRLSGFKPYLLNAPFDEKELMSCLTCDEGWEGLHADFTSIEPAVTAHYSQDPSLLRVFREGKGDVYLDLAVTLFPEDKDLQERYSPNFAVTSETKEKFKRQRKIAKIIQLAVQYTGTKYTVSRNLNAAGYQCTLNDAEDLVQAYWRHFKAVKIMNEAIFLKYRRDGYFKNVVGRIIRVPSHQKVVKKDGTVWEKPIERYKDLPNRIIQSSAHDLLSFWILLITNKVREQRMRAKPIIIDCHDSTTWQCPLEEIEKLENIFKDCLEELNETVTMSVPVKIEMKRFKTLAGLKGEE